MERDGERENRNCLCCAVLRAILVWPPSGGKRANEGGRENKLLECGKRLARRRRRRRRRFLLCCGPCRYCYCVVVCLWVNGL